MASKTLGSNLRAVLFHYRHGAAIIPLFLALAWFLLLQEANTRPVFVMHSPLDDYIPFVKEMVMPYLLWFGMMLAVLCYLLIRAPADFISLAIFMAVMEFSACILYALLPNGHGVRPIVAENDFFSELVRYIHSVDRPTNCVPSLHVAQTLACLIACLKHRNFGRARRPVLWGMFILSLLICMSTVMIKQHSILDAVGSFAMAAACYPFVYVFRKRPLEDKGFVYPYPCFFKPRSSRRNRFHPR